MNGRRVIPLDALPDVVAGPRAPVWWGMILLVAIELTVFATLFSSYFYLGLMHPDWPPPGVQPPDLMLPLINTAVLLTSSVTVFFATRSIKQGQQRRLKIALGLAVLLESAFFVIKLMMSGGIEFTWDDHAYGSIFWLISRLHTGHVLAAILMGIVAEVLALKGWFNSDRRLGMDVVNIYFQFVALVWLPVLLFLFLMPRWT